MSGGTLKFSLAASMQYALERMSSCELDKQLSTSLFTDHGLVRLSHPRNFIPMLLTSVEAIFDDRPGPFCSIIKKMLLTSDDHASMRQGGKNGAKERNQEYKIEKR